MTKKIVEIKKNIVKDTVFYNDTIYVISGDVRVKCNAKLTIENETVIYIKNGIYKDQFGINASRTRLVFESGSTLNAETVYFRACNYNYKEVKKAMNGGIYFVGSAPFEEKDGLLPSLTTSSSKFVADLIIASYLGSNDIISISESAESSIDDYDAINVLGVNNSEWKIKNVISEYSGDDGFDLQNSNINLDSLIVNEPEEDGLNLVSSSLEIKKYLKIIVSVTNVPDRDIFDFEPDTKYCLLKIKKGALVELAGIFGDDLILSSCELPPINTFKTYYFKDKIKNTALVFTSGYLSSN
jgi:hypothetical protein